MFWVHCGLFVLVIAVPGFNSSADSTSKREADYTLDESYWNEESPNGEVEKLLREYRQNEELVRNIGSHSHQIIYPVQLRHHEKMGISTRETSAGKRSGSGDGYQNPRGRSRAGKHFHRTSLLIKAFNHKFRLDLELNTQLLAPNLSQKDFLANGAEQVTKQEIEHCYYHGIVRDYPGASAAFHTCRGVSGVIHLGNETFVIQPFYGGDLSKHPHVIFEARTKSDKGCANTGTLKNLIAKNRRQKHVLGLSETKSDRYKRDIREATKYIETAIVIDKAMFDKRNGSSRADVVHDAIQVANIADLYFRTLNTRVSVVYVETWLGGNQAKIDSKLEIYKALTNFNDYTTRNMYQVSSDTTQLLTGESFQGGESGLATEDTVCTVESVGVSVDVNTYEPHLLAGTMAHMIGHNIGMGHDDGRDGCFCRDWHGCIMAKSIVGLEDVQPYKFSDCSKSDYEDALQNGRGLCLLNKPNELKLSSCGNRVIDDGEQCDCGTLEECSHLDPCCDPITCRLKSESQCAWGLCCNKCKFRERDHVCRNSTNECDLPEVCSGDSGQCPVNVYKKNGTPCSDSSVCFNGVCPSLDLQCKQVWGEGGIAADKECFEDFNSKGSINGHCGTDTSGYYIKCDAENVRCGSLQCQSGKKEPVIGGSGQPHSRTFISINGKGYECKTTTGKIEGSNLPDMGLVYDGTPCGDNLICYNQTCTSIFPHIDPNRCPSNHNNNSCSGNGACTNTNKCYCYPGWSGSDCSIKQEIVTPKPTTSTTEKPGKSTTEIKLQKKETPYEPKRSTLSTTAMVLILLGVVKGVFVSFALMALCYRRKSTVQKYDPPYLKKPAPKTCTLESANHHSAGATLDNVNKILDFDRMPSFNCADSHRVLFQPQNSICNMDGVRLKEHQPQMKRPTIDNDDGGTGSDEAVSFIDLKPNNLAKYPEKGILKKHGGYGLTDETMADMQRTLDSLNGYHGHISEIFKTAKSHRGMSSTQSSSGNLIDEEGLRKSLVDSDYPDMYRKLQQQQQQQQLSQQQQDGQDNIDNQDDEDEVDVPPSCSPMRIRTLEDLIRQLEHHSARHVSPSGSEDLRISEGEGDHHYRIDSSVCSEPPQGSRRCCRLRDDERFVYGRYRQPSVRIPYGTHQHKHQHSHQMHEEEGIYETADPERGSNTRGETPDSESDEFIQAQHQIAQWTSEARDGVGGSGEEGKKKSRRSSSGLEEHRPPQQPPPRMNAEEQLECLSLSLEDEERYRKLLSLASSSSSLIGRKAAIITTMGEKIMRQLKEQRERIMREEEEEEENKLPAKELPIRERGYYPSPPQTDDNGLDDPEDDNPNYSTEAIINEVNDDKMINVNVVNDYYYENKEDDDEEDDDEDEEDEEDNDDDDEEEEEEEGDEEEDKNEGEDEAVNAQSHRDVKLLNNNDDASDAIVTNLTKNPNEDDAIINTTIMREIDVKKMNKKLPNINKRPLDDKYSLGCNIMINTGDDYRVTRRPSIIKFHDKQEDVDDVCDANDDLSKNNTSNNTSDNENTALLPPLHFPEYKH